MDASLKSAAVPPESTPGEGVDPMAEIDPRAAILLVDDRPENLLALEVVLESLGQDLVRATSGREALRHVLERDFAVILLDVSMPDMDGFETAALIRQRKKSEHTPIIFVTAINKTDVHVLTGYSLGAVDYIFKPIVPEILRSKVSVFVELQRKTAQVEHLNKALRQRAADLETANRELETFSYSVSHDLRAPLRSIDGFSQALVEDCGAQLGSVGTDHLQRVRAATQRMGELIDDLLRLSRISRQEMRREQCDLSQVATEVAQGLRQCSPQRNLSFRIAPHLQAQCDPRLMRVVLENLLGNAVKFTSRRNAAHIEFGAVERPEGKRVFFVGDDGAGFDMNYANKLFGAFQRLHREDDFPGTGVGLATVQRIIHRHGGRIWAEAAPDRGATFYFTLEA